MLAAINKTITVVVFAILSSQFFSCSTGVIEETTPSLEKKIEDLITSDSELTSKELSDLSKFIKTNDGEFKKEFPELFEKGELIDNCKLLEFIKKRESYFDLTDLDGVFITLPSCDKETTEEIPISPKLYLERSGSMTFYDHPKGNGEFKSVLTSMLNNFGTVNDEKSIVYVVNDNVYDSKLTFKELVQSNNIFAATNKLGNPKYTDFDLIFKKILKDLKPGEVSLLFSDLIYSPKERDKSYAKVLDEAQALTQNVFQLYAENASLLVLKFNGDYRGRYYPHNGNSVPYSGQRPYYVCVLADNATMDVFLKSDKYVNLRKWNSYKNFENFQFFSSSQTQKNPYYTVDLSDKEIKGDYVQGSKELMNRTKEVHSLEDVEHDFDGKLAISVLVDLSDLYLSESLKTNRQMYAIDSPQKFEVENVIAINNIKGVTHKILISSDKKRGGERKVTIGLKKVFPTPWIEASNSDNDEDVNASSFAETTFGFKSLMNGIDQAYDPDNSSHYFKIALTLKN